MGDDSGIQRKRPHMELGELMGAGWAGRLLKAFNQVEMPTVMLTIFSSGGIDFVGGYYLYQLMKKPLFTAPVGKVDFEGITDGEQVHELLFEQNKLKSPVGWREVISYF